MQKYTVSLVWPKDFYLKWHMPIQEEICRLEPKFMPSLQNIRSRRQARFPENIFKRSILSLDF